MDLQPVLGGVLIGGYSARMGTPKQLLCYRGRTWLDLVVGALEPVVERVVLLGDGLVPERWTGLLRLPDAPAHRGPAAGMVAALRWCPSALWVFAACDMPLLSEPAVRWLLEHVRPGVVAVQARKAAAAPLEPFPGVYDVRTVRLLESVASPSRLVELAPVAVPLVPPELQPSWVNVNTPSEFGRLGIHLGA